jgi:hypothetical protein
MDAEPPKADLPKRKRRWYQFSLRTPLTVVALVCFIAGGDRTAPASDKSERDATEARIARLIETIDDDPDELHFDYTPAVGKLIKVGRPAIRALVDIMLEEPLIRRRRAQRAIEGITMEMMGFRFGQGWDKPESEHRWKKFWDSLDHLRSEASIDERRKSVDKWREWLDRKKSTDQSQPDGH